MARWRPRRRRAGASSSSRTRTRSPSPSPRRCAGRASKPVVTRTAAGALELAGEAEPDLVMLDLSLPDGDGRDVCRELRRRSDVPIVMLTARGTEMDRIVGLELGADDYVVKPFSAREVISRIRAVLRRSAPRDGAGADEKPIRIGELELDPAARVATPRRRGARALAQGVRPARRADAQRRPGGQARGPDVEGLGRQLVRLDEDARRPHRLAAAQARRRPRPAPATSRRCGGSASASPRRRSRSRKPPGHPSAGAGLRPAAGADRPRRAAGGEPARPGRLRGARARPAARPTSSRRPRRSCSSPRSGRPSAASSDVSAASVRGRVIVVDRRGRLLADSAGAPSRPQLRRPARGPGRAATATASRSPATARRSAPTSSPPPRRCSATAAPHGAVRVTQSVAAVNSAVRTSILDLAALAGVVLLLGHRRGGLVAQQIARPIRRLDRAARAASPPATSTRPSRSRAAPSSARWPAPSTR